jgi:uncharacterized membrane protein
MRLPRFPQIPWWLTFAFYIIATILLLIGVATTADSPPNFAVAAARAIVWGTTSFWIALGAFLLLLGYTLVVTGSRAVAQGEQAERHLGRAQRFLETHVFRVAGILLAGGLVLACLVSPLPLLFLSIVAVLFLWVAFQAHKTIEEFRKQRFTTANIIVGLGFLLLGLASLIKALIDSAMVFQSW